MIIGVTHIDGVYAIGGNHDTSCSDSRRRGHAYETVKDSQGLVVVAVVVVVVVVVVR